MNVKTFNVTKKMLKGADEDFISRYAGKYVIKEWNFGEKQDILEMCSVQDFDVETGDIKVNIKSSLYNILQLKTCLREAPSPVTEEFIRELPNRIGAKLLSLVQEVNKEEDEDSEEGKD